MVDGNLEKFLIDMQVEYIGIRQKGLDLFYTGANFFGKYLFALQSNVDRDVKSDGSLELRERDYDLLQNMFPTEFIAGLKSGDEKVYPFDRPTSGDVFNLETLKLVLEGKAVTLQRGASNIDID